jgi:hypothetical protein
VEEWRTHNRRETSLRVEQSAAIRAIRSSFFSDLDEK